MSNLLLQNLLFSEVARWKTEGIPKENELDKLKPLVDQTASNGIPIYYVNFSDIPQIGINPVYKYGFTPHGIYGFPLTTRIYEQIIDVNGSLYGNDRPYIVVFKVNNPDKIMFNKTYSEESMNIDLQKLSVKNDYEVKKFNNANEDEDDFKNIWEIIRSIVKFKEPKSYQVRLKNDNYNTHLNADPIEWRKKFVELGYEGAVDIDSNTISNDIFTQAVFFTPLAIKQEFIIYNPFSKRSPHNIHFKNKYVRNKLKIEPKRTEDEIEGIKTLVSYLKSLEKTLEQRQEIIDLYSRKKIKQEDFAKFILKLDDKNFFTNTVIGSLTELRDLEQYNFSGTTFLENGNYSLIDFINCNFSKTSFVNCALVCSFNRCNFYESNLKDVRFLQKISNTSFINAKIEDCDFFKGLFKCDLSGTKFINMDPLRNLTLCKRDSNDPPIKGYEVENGILVR